MKLPVRLLRRQVRLLRTPPIPVYLSLCVSSPRTAESTLHFKTPPGRLYVAVFTSETYMGGNQVYSRLSISATAS